jgi:hypothetical protein
MAGMTGAVAVLTDGREIDVTGFYVYDIDNDLAIIQVGQDERFSYVTIGDYDTVRVGDSVYAIGGPDGDPITFTDGMISRLADESVTFGGTGVAGTLQYSIAGMLQSTAAVYGGSSGGPLLNSSGQVIGINSAGHNERASVQWAVPINRVDIPNPGSSIRTLPIGGVPEQTHTPGQSFMYTQFPFIPDFLSVSRNATLTGAGSAATFDLDFNGIYEYVYIYSLTGELMIPDTDEYDTFLFEAGFEFQDVINHGDAIWVYFYHRGQNTSLSYAMAREQNILVIAIGSGNAYETYYAEDAPATTAATAPPQTVDPSQGVAALVGTWECPDPDNHIWFCRLMITSNGRFTDLEGDSGTVFVEGNSITFEFERHYPWTFDFILNGDALILYNDGSALVQLNRQ